MTRHAWLWISVVCWAIAGVTVIEGQSAHPPFMLGVLETNGALTPLFRYQQGEWSAPWPSPAEGKSMAIPGSVKAIPPAWWPGFSSQGWTAIFPDGRHPVRVQDIKQPNRTDSGCTETLALQTDFRWTVPPRANSRPEMAVAVGTVVVRPTTTFDKDSIGWRLGGRRLNAVLATNKHSTRGLTIDLVALIPSQNGSNLWEVEAGGAGRFVRLWYSDTNTFLHLEDAPAQFDREEIGRLAPLGAIWGLGRATFLAWDQGYDGGRYAIIRMDADGPARVITAGGGGC